MFFQVKKVYNMCLRGLEFGLLGISGTFIVLAAVFMGSEVIGRYVFRVTHFIMETLNPAFMIYATFLGTAVLLKSGSHVAINLLPGSLEGRYAKGLSIMIEAIVLLGCVWATYGGILAVVDLIESGRIAFTEIIFPQWYITLAFPLGFACACLFTMDRLVRTILRPSASFGKGSR